MFMGFVAAYIPPDKYWIFSFAGLIFPYVVIINLFFVFAWMVLGRKLFLIPLLALLICWNRLTNYIQFNKDKEVNEQELFKILSYNVQIFDLYNWKGGNISTKADNLLNLIKDENPDLLCLQEYHAGKKNIIDIKDSIHLKTGLQYNQIASVVKNGKNMPYGIAIYSRWPIIHKEEIFFDNNPLNFCIYSDIVIKKDTIRLYNIHLESIRLSNEDYLYVSELANNGETSDLFADNSKKILRKFKRAFVKRASQARKIASMIEQSPYPVIMCGDFNDTPSSYTYHKLSAGMLDAFKESGSGIGHTYGGSLPSFRIDYILHDKQFVSSHFNTIRSKFSDHYPITTSLKLEN